MRRRYLKGMSLMGLFVLATAAVWATVHGRASAHCQVPCGIYDDAARISRLKEDASTIAKAITQINELSANRDAQSANQLIRWVTTKEDHASHIIHVMAEYFLCQRVKPVDGDSAERGEYLKRLAEHHAVMVEAMKTKQSADPAAVMSLNKAIEKIAGYY